MAIFRNTDNLPAFKNAVITIGTFDGVHKGHRMILNEVVTHAKNISGESILLTFEPHPRKLLFPDQPLGIITPLEEKLQLATGVGIQHIVIVPFTKEFANLPAHDYVEKFLVKIFHPHSIIIGYDHRFGYDRKGDIKLLEDYASEYNYELLEIPAHLIDEAAVSSTKIRRAITEGRIEDATQMLGRHYSLSGMVVHGHKLGRTLGYPTANVHPVDADQIIPGLGIYAIYVVHNGAKYGAMLSIGYNPTVSDKKELRIEANIFDFDKDIYDDVIELIFIKKLRDEQKFNSLDELKEQLHKDKQDTLSVISDLQR